MTRLYIQNRYNINKNQTENEYPPFGSKPVYLSRMNSSEKILKKKVI